MEILPGVAREGQGRRKDEREEGQLKSVRQSRSVCVRLCAAILANERGGDIVNDVVF